ncbi:hypothetical protein P5775_11910 [Bacillus cereus]|nr:hypothetical protein [Bacillus cereus]MDF9623449.1 hypothetical protein [Bacillus cereus]
MYEEKIIGIRNAKTTVREKECHSGGVNNGRIQTRDGRIDV